MTEGAMNPYQRARATEEVAKTACSGRDTARCRRLGVYLSVLMSVSAMIMCCGDKVKPGTAEVKRPVITGVSISEVAPVRVEEHYETSGTVKARTISAIASRVMASVLAVHVKEGDRVKEGQLLVTLDNSDSAQRVKAAEKAVEAAQQNLSLADITYQRYRKLYDGRALTEQEIDQVETQRNVAGIELERAKAALAEAEVQRSFGRISALRSGVVTGKRVEPGNVAVPGVPLLTLEDTSSYTVEVHADESLSGKLRPGMAVPVSLEALGREVKGAIEEVVPSVDQASRTFLVKISVKGEGLKTGHYAKVRLPVGKREALLVSRDAVVYRGQLTGVYTVDHAGIISYRLVKTGKEYDRGVEVLSGITAKDRIITTGMERVVDGGVIAQ